MAVVLREALDRKRLSTLSARAALAGIAVHVLDTDTGTVEFIATRWSLTKAFDSLDALAFWLDTLDTNETAKDLYA